MQKGSSLVANGAFSLAALRDFDPADVRFGSIASDQARQRLRPMSALPQKRTSSRSSR
jgi:hypothetical protein